MTELKRAKRGVAHRENQAGPLFTDREIVLATQSGSGR